ncbi:MAG: VOC family protein [Pseudomonadota bacterium]
MAETNSHTPGSFCWIELGTSNQTAAKEFYGKLFDWTYVDMPMGPDAAYTIFKLRDRDVAAAYTLDEVKQANVPPHWMPYIATKDADATVKRSLELGGEVIAPAFDVFDLGRMAVLKDPTGAIHNIWQAAKNTGLGVTNEPGAFCWGQLNTSDMNKAQNYYTALFNWTAHGDAGGASPYTEWHQNGVPIGGMMNLPPEANSPAHWLVYFAVEDCDATAEKAQSLGAQCCVAPTDIPGVGRFAVLADPQGAFFAIYRA